MKLEFNFSETRPNIERRDDEDILRVEHEQLGSFAFDINSMDDQPPELLFTENETNFKKLYQTDNESPYVKDAFHEYLINGKKNAINPQYKGTKAALHYKFNIKANSSKVLNCRLYKLSDNDHLPEKITQKVIDQIFNERKNEADQFYESVYEGKLTDDEKNIIRQAYASLLHTKQFYHYVVKYWIEGEGKHFMPAFEDRRKQILKNTSWEHM